MRSAAPCTRRLFSLGRIALLHMAAAVVPAIAADAYVCDGGRLVYARPETLERLKQTDPCIASYHGIDLAKKAPPAGPAVVRTAAAAPLVVDKRPLSQASAAPGLVRQPAERSAPDARLYTAMGPQATAKPRRPAQASPGTDFRTVRILNAGPGSPQTFHHAR